MFIKEFDSSFNLGVVWCGHLIFDDFLGLVDFGDIGDKFWASVRNEEFGGPGLFRIHMIIKL